VGIVAMTEGEVVEIVVVVAENAVVNRKLIKET
jgi:hypothetical protein